MSDAAAARAPATQVVAAPNRWIPALIFLATLLVVSVLLFVRVPSTTIELTGSFGGVGFVSAREQPLGRPLRVVALGVSGARDVRLPDDVPSSARSTAVRVAVDDTTSAMRAGSIVVDRIMIPDGAQVWLSRTEVPRQYRLSLRAPSTRPIEIHADLTGALAFAPAGTPRTAVTLRAPRELDFRSADGTLDLDLTLAPGAASPRWEQLVVRDLRLHRVDDEQGVPRLLARPVSTIQSGSLYLEALGGTERKLRPGEMLRFGAATGTFLTLDLRDDGIAATFQGDVREMRSGSGDEPRSLMPTLLEWLRKRQGLSLLWGTALYLSGIALTLRKWWRKPE